MRDNQRKNKGPIIEEIETIDDAPGVIADKLRVGQEQGFFKVEEPEDVKQPELPIVPVNTETYALTIPLVSKGNEIQKTRLLFDILDANRYRMLKALEPYGVTSYEKKSDERVFVCEKGKSITIDKNGVMHGYRTEISDDIEAVTDEQAKGFAVMIAAQAEMFKLNGTKNIMSDELNLSMTKDGDLSDEKFAEIKRLTKMKLILTVGGLLKENSSPELVSIIRKLHFEGEPLDLSQEGRNYRAHQAQKIEKIKEEMNETEKVRAKIENCKNTLSPEVLGEILHKGVKYVKEIRKNNAFTHEKLESFISKEIFKALDLFDPNTEKDVHPKIQECFKPMVNGFKETILKDREMKDALKPIKEQLRRAGYSVPKGTR